MRRSGRVIGAILLLALAGAGGLAADDLSGRVFLGWQSFDNGSLETDGLVQRYDLRLDRALSDVLRVSLTLRATDDSSGSTFQGEERTSDYRDLRPGIQLSYVLPTLQLNARWDRLLSKSSGTLEGSKSDRTLDQLAATLAYRPEGLPALIAEGRRTSLGDSVTGADVVDEIGILRLEYAWRGLHASLSGYSAREDNRGLRFERTSDNLQATLGWAGALWDDRLTIAADALVSREEIDRRALPGAAVVPNPIRIAEAYETHDDTPSDNRDHPLAANPRLRDGDLNRPAGVPLGPESATNLNLAADFGRFARVDELRVVARDATGNPLPSGGSVAWDLWTSIDGLLWVPVPGASSRFDAVQGYWSVTFPRQETRYLKVVTFFVNSIPTEVTELLAFEFLETKPGLAQRLDLDLVTGTGNVTYRPLKNLQLTWGGVFNRREQRPEDGVETSTRDSDQSLRLLWEIRPRTSLEVTRQATRATQRGEATLEQSYDSWRGVFRWAPNLNLQTSVEAERTETDTAGLRFTSDRYFLHGFARFWKSIDANLDVGHQSYHSEEEGWTISGPQVTGVAHVQIVRSLLLTATASRQWNRVSGGAPIEIQVAENVSRYWAELFWRPSPQLGIGVRAGEARSDDRSTPLRGYRLDWRPFARGAITVGAIYDEDVDVAGDRRTRRWILTPAWQINRRLTLQLNYLRLETSSPVFDEVADSVYAGLTWTF